MSKALLRSKNIEQISSPQSRASWQSCVKEIKADVVDLPLENPHCLSDKGDVAAGGQTKGCVNVSQAAYVQ